MTLVFVLAQSRLSVRLLALFDSSRHLTYFLQPHLCLTTHLRLTRTLIFDSYSRYCRYSPPEYRSFRWRRYVSSRDRRPLLTQQSSSIPAFLRYTQHLRAVSHIIWLGGEGDAHRRGGLQLLEESECIHCPSFTDAVCSRHSPARP
jgi:hypothetical protein